MTSSIHVDCIFRSQAQLQQINALFQLLPSKSPRDQISPPRKRGWSHSRIIYIPNCYIPSPKSVGPVVLKKKRFLRLLQYMDMVAVLVIWPGPSKLSFLPLPEGCVWNVIKIGPVVSEEVSFENDDWQVTFKEHNSNRKIYFFSFSNSNSKYKIGPCHKICQGQHRFIIYINFEKHVLDSQLLQTKFQVNWPSGSEENF